MEKLLTPFSAEQLEGLDVRASEEAGVAPPEEDREPTKSYRSPSQRDRDRILYTAAFARLAYVTQVSAPESGHTFHNRLSHSLKVAQVGRRNAERLLSLAEQGGLTGATATLVGALNPDAVEASCLAHDLGHPPFGHIAEQVLHECACNYMDDGFEGNAQSFRLVTRLCVRTATPGLDLTRRTLDGLLKYPWLHRANDPALPKREHKWGAFKDDVDAFEFARKGWPPEKDEVLAERCLAAELMDWADDLTYAVHDVDDFFRAGLVPLDRLGSPEGPDSAEGKKLAEMLRETKAASPGSFPGFEVDELVEAATRVIGRFGPTAAYEHTTAARAQMRVFGSKLITRYLGAFTLADDPDSGKVRLSIDPKLELEVEALKLLVVAYVVRRPALAVVQHGQQRIIRELFESYFESSKPKGDRRVFPPSARERLDAAGENSGARARVVVDLVAGLTESAAVALHHRLSGGTSGPMLDATAIIG